ncbi:hypothetical protein C2E23DRAFT_837951, partial [Lenzites betulinus]
MLRVGREILSHWVILKAPRALAPASCRRIRLAFSRPPPPFNLYQASALPVNIPSESMNGDVNLLGLGDVAGTL